MAHSFITTNVGFSPEYKRYLFGYPVKHDKVNEPDLLDFSLASGEDPAFVKLSRGCYVKLTTDTYGLWFSGYITNEPELQFLGAHPTTGAAVYGYVYQATSDDYILNLQPVGLLPPYINTTVGGIIRDLAGRIAPGVFVDTDVDDGPIVAYFPVDPNKKFGEIVKELADNTFYRFWAKDHALHFKKMDTIPANLVIDGDDEHFTPSNLSIRQDNAPIVNDVTVLGQVEPQDYMNEFFIGDGLTGRFPLLAGVYGVAKMTQLDEVFSGSDIDQGKWDVEDPGGVTLVADNGYLNALGGTGDISDTYLMTVNPIPLEGTLRLTHGEWDFVSSSTGVIASLWTVPPSNAYTGCVFGIRVNGTTLNPIVNGVVDTGQSFSIDTTKRFIIRTIAAFEEVYRYSDAYNYIDQSGTVGTYGGEALSDKVVYTTTLVTIDPTDGTIFDTTTWTNTATVADTTLAAFYVPMACADLHATVTAITISVPIQATLEHKNQGEVDWTLDTLGPNDLDAQDGNTPVATIVATQGGQQIRTTHSSIRYNPADAELQYFKDSIRHLSNVPAESSIVHIRYRRAGAAIGRVQDATSIAAEAAIWGDNGRRSLVRKDLDPAPRTSDECEFAAAAILKDAVYQHYEGSYEHPHRFSFTGEPVAGTILEFANLPDYADLQAEMVKEVTTVFRNILPGELFMHTVQFGRENFAEKLLSGIGNPRGAVIPQDAAEIPEYIDTANVGLAFAPNVTGSKFAGFTTTTWDWDAGQVPPAGGGLEIRYTDASWGTDPSKNLVTRLTGATQTFSTPRTDRGKICWIRAYDASGNYSRFSAGLRTTLPLIPDAPTAFLDFGSTGQFLYTPGMGGYAPGGVGGSPIGDGGTIIETGTGDTSTLTAEMNYNSSGNPAYKQTITAMFSGKTVIANSPSVVKISINSGLYDDSENAATPIHLSNQSIRDMFPSIGSKKIWMHLTPWWGKGGHPSIGINNNTDAWVKQAIDSLIARGVSGVIIDWYGQGDFTDQVTQKIRDYIEDNSLSFEFIVQIDKGTFKNTPSAGTTATLVSQINYLNSEYFGSSKYGKTSSKPILMFFDVPDVPGINMTSAKSSTSATNAYWINQGSGALGFGYNDAAYSWAVPWRDGPAAHTGDPYNKAYFNTFSSGVGTNPHMLSVYPGFNGTLTKSEAWSYGKYFPRDEGNCWLEICSHVNSKINAGTLGIQIMTYNDYEEGTALEAGIQNEVAISASITGDTLDWVVTGGQGDDTIHHYEVFASVDGQNLTKLSNVAVGTTTLDLTAYPTILVPGKTYQIRVKAEGKAFVCSKMSDFVNYVI